MQHIRVKLLPMILIALLLAASVALAQEETPDVTAEATLEPSQETVLEITDEATPEVLIAPVEGAADETEDVAVVDAETPLAEGGGEEPRGLPLGVLLIGAVAVLMIGTVVLIRENPRPMDEEE